MIDAVLSLSPLLGKMLLHFLWQGALIGAIAASALAMLRDARPQARYAVACAALFLALLLPGLTLAWLLATPATTIAIAATGATNANGLPVASWHALPAATSFHFARYLPWLTVGWVTGVTLLSLRTLGGLYWVARLRRHAWADASLPWQAASDRLAARLGLRIQVPLRLSANAGSPLAVGCWRPLVLLPAALALQMPAPLLEALIAHELAHIRRHDYLVNLLQCTVETLLFYHPVVWWLSRRIRSERELIADALAAEALGERRQLALALSELERLLATSAPPLPHLAPAAQGGQLMSRIQRLIHPHAPVAPRPLLPLLGLSLAGLALAGITLYAQATTPPGPAPRHPVPLQQVPPPTPPAPPAPPAPPQATLPAPPAPPAPPVPPTPPTIAYQDHGDGYALVRKGDTHYLSSGDRDDMRRLEKLRADIDGDFLWVQKDGRRFVLRDAALLDAIEAAWAPLQPLNGQMDSLQAKMAPHQQRLEQLQQEMEQLPQPQSSPEMDAANARLHALVSQQHALAMQQAQLARRARQADDAQREDLERELDRLSERMDALSAQMDAQSRLIERQSERMQQQGERMQAIGERMRAAGQPMQAIGEEMNAVGERIQRAADSANAKTHRLIESAFARGLAQPVG